MSETRKLAAILVADVVGYSRLAGADEDRTLARLRGLRSDLIDPAIAAHRGRIVKRTGEATRRCVRHSAPHLDRAAHGADYAALATRTSTSAPCRVRLHHAPAIRKPK